MTALSVPSRSELPASLYRETAGPAAPTPPLAQDRRCDVAIVGGGFTGLSAALHLRLRGVDAVVLETHEPGWGASGRNGGQVNPGLKAEPDEIERTFGPELGRRMIALSGGAPDLVFRLIRDHAIACAAQQTGTLRAAFAPRDAGTIQRTADAWAARSLPTDYLDRDAMARATGTDRYLNGVIDRRGGTLNPLAYARGLAEAAIREGAAIHGRTHVSSMSRRDGRWLLTTPGGSVSADWVVLATNGYTDDLWPGLRKTVVPVFSGIVASEPLDEDLRSAILPGRPAVYEIGSITTYYRVDDGGRLLMGGRSVLHSAEGPEAFGSLSTYARKLWPGLSRHAWTHGWNGRIAITRDHYPHFHEPAPQVIAALGYNGRGVAMATAMGSEIARRITGTPGAELAMPVTGLLPFPFHSFWPIGAAARIAYGRIRDRLKL
ncbi:NAD(P)/FAD-dependent oxidoreductase [Enterovirga rhinocerotis]|uniref:Glycine/D-amino acid oxidase-like deaminating enzyme n=1 Tax=Enterovirga rhinocerotis TaxID=1339210 RepID=A0A4R7C1F5_9HYPH|nr:FAD-binding oxidoreductase [Enterovirga rhinocerotis]TDR90216.1 glycine/D-amino acid oxidase-like deaminating enzyme [Enterovirga rhinocerotis]